MTDAHVIASGAEAIEVARSLVPELAAGADARDRDRALPHEQVERLSSSGLLAITVPSRFGGAEVPVVALAEVFRLLATADGSLSQVPQSHVVFLDALRRNGTQAQQEHWFGAVLQGQRLANAQTEKAGRTVTHDATALRRREGGGWLLDGTKAYATGASFAHGIVVRAVLADDPGTKVLVYLERDRPGIAVEDDWDGMGQRTTASGTVRLEGVLVEDGDVVPFAPLFEGPTTYGARAQVLHAAIDVGIARGALDAGVQAVTRARPWFEADVDRAADDPLLVQQAGELEITVRAAEALLREGAQAIDDAEAEPTDESTARASVAVAVAKVAGARAALEASSALFELGGTRTAAGSLNLSRHWRDARTHTLHDPTRWKVQHVGRWTLDGTPPPRHGQI